MSIQLNLDRFLGKKWGIFHHFLGRDDGVSWSKRVDKVNVNLWAEQLAELGAGFMGITMMQVTQCMLAPNETYNRITGYKTGEACAERDFVLDLSDALRKYDIDLMLYYTGDGPCRDAANIANKAFGFTTPRLINGKWVGVQEPKFPPESFVDKWTEVLKEYALRYGDRVFAWWFDGCYASFYPDDCRERMLGKYKDAVRAGNHDVLTTFNGGFNNTQIKRHSIHDDFTAGETGELIAPPTSRYVNGAQWFEFLCNGFWWDGGDRSTGIWYSNGEAVNGLRYTPEQFRDYVRDINNAGGIVMFDTKFVNDEYINEKQFKCMSLLKELK